MARDSAQHLLAFVAVAREGSFTRAADKLGVTPSALSHAVRNFESSMGVRLLDRTTRRVSPTEIGDELLHAVGSSFEEIEAEMATISALRHEPMGTVRITATDFVADTLLWPRISPVLHRYPRIKVDIITSYEMTNVVTDRFDFGVRSGSEVDKDMVARRISADYRRVIVGSPAYFNRKAPPATPEDLAGHSCIAMRLASSGALYSWGLKKGKKSVQVRVGGQLTFNNTYQILDAALSGCGLAFTPEPLVQASVSSGRLRVVLEDWSPTSPGFYLYYPRRGQHSRAAALILEALSVRLSQVDPVPRDNITDLLAFVAVVREKSFTRAAAKLGVSQSSLSDTISQLEKRMDVRLVTRTTRSVSATELGAQLLQAVSPRLARIEEAMAEVAEQGESPAGLVRIAVVDHFAATVLWPRLARLVPDHPDLRLEMHIGAGPSESDQEEYDIGFQWGAEVAEDRVALRVTPDCRIVIVGSPAYLASHALPHQPADLLRHNCITMQTDDGTSLPWGLQQGERKLNMRVSGQCSFNSAYQMRSAALSGNGLAFLLEDLVKAHVAEGQLTCVLEDWSPRFPGLHLQYARRRESSKTIGLVVAAMRAGPQVGAAYPSAEVVGHW